MTDFNSWLEGFLEGKDKLNEKEVEIIRKKLKTAPKPQPTVVEIRKDYTNPFIYPPNRPMYEIGDHTTPLYDKTFFVDYQNPQVTYGI